MKKVIVNNDVIDSGEIIDILGPLYKDVSFESDLIYRKTLDNFTKEQQLVFVLDCYQAEVYNGGHEQFFYNTTGIVWKDAIEALEYLGFKEELTILSTALTLFDNNSPSFDAEERQDQLEKIEENGLDFDELDEQFYEKVNLDEKIRTYINKHRAKFYSV